MFFRKADETVRSSKCFFCFFRIGGCNASALPLSAALHPNNFRHGQKIVDICPTIIYNYMAVENGTPTTKYRDVAQFGSFEPDRRRWRMK